MHPYMHFKEVFLVLKKFHNTKQDAEKYFFGLDTMASVKQICILKN